MHSINVLFIFSCFHNILMTMFYLSHSDLSFEGTFAPPISYWLITLVGHNSDLSLSHMKGCHSIILFTIWKVICGFSHVLSSQLKHASDHITALATMVTADDCYTNLGCLVDIFGNPGLKNCWLCPVLNLQAQLLILVRFI